MKILLRRSLSGFAVLALASVLWTARADDLQPNVSLLPPPDTGANADTSADLTRVVELVNNTLRVVDRPNSTMSMCIAEDGFNFADNAALQAYRTRHKVLSHEISYTRAEHLFDVLANEHHIPFRYPDDGCYARAHEMSRILEVNGVYSRKVWIFGDLHAATPYGPPFGAEGSVDWGWHVAPVVSVRMPNGTVQDMVIDPSLETQPVTYDTWRARMTSERCPIVDVSASGGSGCSAYMTERFTYMTDSDPHATAWSDADLAASNQTMADYLQIQHQRGF
ncbi:MAG TPA: protein-glutamine glutaminase family protein [Bdellovibrionota bacterium]|nr:protein-glutamine glutaminase family protein [Bdellovibrionota bacterium]